ncbi:tRNA isopentenyltransferase [Hanseniaspora valbyensis NRRL Y-1626]|uniref:tRNA dimethylallyltransferase n=1 Tax=Hanseniaspora valbyensis NRRL Y-1626 TaxID=766949 RepID=A0A1B7TH95_9ASCO|nr:tRNA isopentenyltransferase [Hanseniaspora valbyensis NRRL Y-1626]
MNKTKQKIIVILGSTATGKSDISIQLATKFNGEIINSDSMQIYKDVDIVSNKHPMEERNGIPHHLMDFLPLTESYNLKLFEKQCNEKINEIHSRSKLPIVVGGTHYYLQALFNKCINETISKENWTSEQKLFIKENEFNPSKLYEELNKIDPLMANKWHPNDNKRVLRMIEIYYSTGNKPSDIYLSQDLSLRYDTLFFWVYSDAEILNQRLDSRVDKMFDNGATEEVQFLYKKFKEYKIDEDLEENMKSGIWQVIGFREFLPWLESGCTDKKLFEEGKTIMKTKTRQYAKKQIKWIKNTLIPDIKGENMFILDASDLKEWSDNVEDRAACIAKNFLEGNDITKFNKSPERLSNLLDFSALKNLENVSNPIELKLNQDKFVCENCKDKNGKNLIIVGEDTYKLHLSGRKHKQGLHYMTKRMKFENWKKEQENKTKKEWIEKETLNDL